MRSLKMLSSMASREVLRELANRFEALQGCEIMLEAAGGVEVVKRVRGGEPADAIVLARNSIDALGAEGLVLKNSITDLVQSGIAVAVPTTADTPDISSEAAVRRAVEQARSVSYSTGPSGVYLEGKFASWGILEALRARIVVPPPGTPVASLVASGKVTLGFQQLPELINAADIRLVGLLPPDVQLMTTFSGAIATHSSNVDTARQLLAYIASAQTREVKRQFGMDAC